QIRLVLDQVYVTVLQVVQIGVELFFELRPALNRFDSNWKLTRIAPLLPDTTGTGAGGDRADLTSLDDGCFHSRFTQLVGCGSAGDPGSDNGDFHSRQLAHDETFPPAVFLPPEYPAFSAPRQGGEDNGYGGVIW